MFLICSHEVIARRSVSRVLSRPWDKPLGGDGHSSGTFVAERLARPTRAAARKARPAAPASPTSPAAPTWSCSRWGLPCRRRCRQRGALLPHHFTLAASAANRGGGSAVCFCGTFPRVAPAGRYPAPYLRGARTFLFPRKRKKRPSDRLAPGDLGCRGASVKGSSGGFRISKEAVQANPARRPAAKVLSSGVGRKSASAFRRFDRGRSPVAAGSRRRRAIQPGRARPSPTAGSWNTATSPACLSGHASPG